MPTSCAGCVLVGVPQRLGATLLDPHRELTPLVQDHFRALVAKVASESKGMSLTQSMAAVMDADDQSKY